MASPIHFPAPGVRHLLTNPTTGPVKTDGAKPGAVHHKAGDDFDLMGVRDPMLNVTPLKGDNPHDFGTFKSNLVQIVDYTQAIMAQHNGRVSDDAPDKYPLSSLRYVAHAVNDAVQAHPNPAMRQKYAQIVFDTLYATLGREATQDSKGRQALDEATLGEIIKLGTLRQLTGQVTKKSPATLLKEKSASGVGNALADEFAFGIEGRATKTGAKPMSRISLTFGPGKGVAAIELLSKAVNVPGVARCKLLMPPTYGNRADNALIYLTGNEIPGPLKKLLAEFSTTLNSNDRLPPGVSPAGPPNSGIAYSQMAENGSASHKTNCGAIVLQALDEAMKTRDASLDKALATALKNAGYNPDKPQLARVDGATRTLRSWTR
ncbi:MAG: hypothetical protein JWP52_3473 [Rhizobacter sp.]|nr:hypothetical protein [Rhizobacter sp.]